MPEKSFKFWLATNKIKLKYITGRAGDHFPGSPIDVDGDQVREAYIEPSGCVLDGIRSVIDCDMRNRMNKAEDHLEQAEKELDKYRRFISHYKLLDRFNTFEDGE